MNGQHPKTVRRATLVFLMAGLAISQLSAGCVTHVWDTSPLPSHLSRLQPFIPGYMQPEFAAQLTPIDWLITYQFEHAAQLCDGQKQLDAIGFRVCCTTSSGILFFVVPPERDFYRITPLPIADGSRSEMSGNFPVTLHLWRENDDKICDGSLQHYSVSEYAVIDGKPNFVHESITKQQFEPGEFDAHRIVLLPVNN